MRKILSQIALRLPPMAMEVGGRKSQSRSEGQKRSPEASVRRPVVLLSRSLSLAGRQHAHQQKMNSEGREKYEDSIVKSMGKGRAKDLGR